MSEEWLKIIKEKLESYEAPVPEGLWESVEASLFPQKTRKTRVLPWVWGLAAAAAVAAGVFIGVRLVDSSRDPIPQDDRIAVDGLASPDKTPSSSVDEGRGQSSAESAPIHLIPAPPRSAVAVAEDVPGNVPEVPVAAVDQAEAANVTETANVTEVAEVAEAAEVAEISEVTEAAEVAEAKEDSEVTEVPEVAQDGFKTTHDGVDWSRLRSADDYRRGNHGPSAGISLSSAGNKYQDYSTFDTRPFYRGVSANMDVATKSEASIYSNTMSVQVNREADHKRPIRFALSLDLPLNDIFSVQSGLTYSVLRSSFTTSAGGRVSEDTQVLGYLGIPLDLKANLLDKDLFTVYAMGGGMVEKCLSAVTKSVVSVNGQRTGSPVKNTFSLKPLVWSVNASAGLQFNLPWNLGVYAEPGISYHFADDSVVSSIYTEHPFDFIMTFGARISFR